MRGGCAPLPRSRGLAAVYWATSLQPRPLSPCECPALAGLPISPIVSPTPLFELAQRYDVLEEIGRGGHAVVYRAHDRLLMRDVAIKLLNRGTDTELALARFTQEVRVTASLEHAHILHVHDTGRHVGQPYLVMELAPDGTLASRIAREGQLPVEDALQIARDISLALSYAHKQNILHRDIKPANILLGRGGALLADFGVALVTSNSIDDRLTYTGVAVGTVQYMSPEQLCAERDIDARSDQYSLACVLYEMLAGVRPHIAASAESLRLQRIAGRHLSVREHRPSVPVPVDLALQRALSPMPADRFRDIDAFYAAITFMEAPNPAIPGSGGYALQGVSSETPSVASTMAASRTAANGGTASRVRVLAPLMLVLLLVAAGVAYAWKGRTPASDGAAGMVSVLVEPIAENADTASWRVRVHRSLHNELGAWPGVRVVERVRANDTTAMRMTPSVAMLGDSLRMLLDVQRGGGAAVQRVSALVAVRDAGNPGMVIASLVREALAGAREAEAPGMQGLPERSLVALRAHVRGHMMLRAGHLDSAETSFRASVQAAPRFGHAAYWAAQTVAWRTPSDVGAWSALTATAVRSGVMHGMDSMFAQALAHLARQEYAQACRVYQDITSQDAEAWVAWYGQGDCVRFDSLVVRTPAGLAFRSSSWQALQAYRRWSAVVPTSPLHAALFAPVMRATYAVSSQSRPGIGDDGARTPYFAMPSLVADTLAFFPVRAEEFQRGAPGSVPTTWQPAMTAGRNTALDITQRWTDRSPESADAWFHRAIALELAGRNSKSDAVSADAALDSAESRYPSSRRRVAILVARVRVALRRGDVDVAMQLARAAIADTGMATSLSALAPLAAFVGDLDATRRFSRLSRGVNASLPAALADSLFEFRLRAELGECIGLAERKRAIDALFVQSVPSPQQPAVRSGVLMSEYRNAVPCLGPSALDSFAPRIPRDSAYARLALGDAPGARRILQAARAGRSGATSSRITWDYLYAESWALARAGDSAAARAQLRSAVGDIASMSLYTLDFTAQAAGLRRGLALLDSLR